MKKWLLALVLMVMVSMVLAACGDTEDGGSGEVKEDFKTDIQMGTGSTGGTYFPLGQEIATVMKKNVETDGFNVSAVSTGASLENLAKISRGELQLGMTVHVPAIDAFEGKGEFDGAKVENFGFIGHIYPEVMQVVTLNSTGVESIADLKGKRVAIGPPGSGTQTAAKLILEAHGIKDGDYEQFEEGFGDAKKKLQDGQLDATFGFLGLPAASVNELYAATKDVKYLEVKGEALDYIKENSKYEAFTIETDNFEWLSNPVETITAYAIMVGSTSQISEELGYEITKAMVENAGDISHDQGKHLTKENALKGSENLPMHPGAEKYYKEVGLLE